jgi:hypothetical protein
LLIAICIDREIIENLAYRLDCEKREFAFSWVEESITLTAIDDDTMETVRLDNEEAPAVERSSPLDGSNSLLVRASSRIAAETNDVGGLHLSAPMPFLSAFARCCPSGTMGPNLSNLGSAYSISIFTPRRVQSLVFPESSTQSIDFELENRKAVTMREHRSKRELAECNNRC